MRRVASHRSYKTSRNASPSDSFNGSSFRKSQRRRGQSLMRRTELSWEKLNRRNFNQQESQILEKEERGKINDYLLNQQSNWGTSQEKIPSRTKNPKNSNPTFQQRIQFLRKSKDMAPKFQTQISSKMSHMYMRPLSKKSGEKLSTRCNQILTVKSLKSLNTTDSNNKRESGDSGDSEAYASFYQMNQILQNAFEVNGNRRYACKKIPEKSTYQEYQLYGSNNQSPQLDSPMVGMSPGNNTTTNRHQYKNNNYFPTEQGVMEVKSPYKTFNKIQNKNIANFQKGSSRAKDLKSSQSPRYRLIPEKSPHHPPMTACLIEQEQSQTNKMKKSTTSRNKSRRNYKNYEHPNRYNEQYVQNNKQDKHQRHDKHQRQQKQRTEKHPQRVEKQQRHQKSKLRESKHIYRKNQEEKEYCNLSKPAIPKKQYLKQKKQLISPTQAGQSILSNVQSPQLIPIEKKQVNIKQSLGADLPLYSRNNSMLNTTTLMNISNLQKVDTGQNILARISVHLQIIGELAEYCKGMIEMYEDLDDWEQLIFLMYKKYYIERLKVLNVLKSAFGTKKEEYEIPKNPFVLSPCKVSLGELSVLPTKKRSQTIKLIKQIETENTLIWDSMRNFYNIIIDKSGNAYINLDNHEDNFDNLIFQDINVEINLLEEMMAQKVSSSIKSRLKQIYKTAFLISELDNKFIIGYEESLEDEVSSEDLFGGDGGGYISKAKFMFKKYWHILSK